MISRAEPYVQFGRGQYEEHFCEIISNLDQWQRRRCPLQIIFIFSCGGHCDQQSSTICAILEGGNMRNISVKLY